MAGLVKFIEDVRDNEIGEEVIVFGWVHKKRLVGQIIFLVIRDRTGDVQVLFKNLSEELMKKAEELSHEDVVSIRGTLQKKTNKDGSFSIEVVANNLKTLSRIQETPPFTPLTVHETNEITRLKYRYLDLRSKEKQDMLKKRGEVISMTRNYLERSGFMSAHTPLLAKATPEGARDFLVPSREYKGKFYALPQSPQIYKQLLMASGVERYYQIAPSFRDEDARSDRHQEFYEIDLEASYVRGVEIRRLVTRLIKRLVGIVLNKEEAKSKVTWKTIKYRECLDKYGSDKPDLRFDMQTYVAKKVISSEVFKQLEIDEAAIRVMFFNKVKDLNCLKEISEKAKVICKQIPYKKGFKLYSFDKKHEIMTILNFENGKEEKRTVNIHKSKLSKELRNTVAFIPNCSKSKNDTWKVNHLFSQLRDHWGKTYLLDETLPKFAFAWVTEFPFFEKDKKTGELTPMHHPFTKPELNSIDDLTPENATKIKSTSFDIICNGYELGSGSERIIDRETQNKIFELIDLDKKEVKNKFGFFIDAFKYGVPPHAGIGMGLERILMVLLNKDNIRDVIPFPKSADGFDHMTNSPSIVDIKK